MLNFFFFTILIMALSPITRAQSNSGFATVIIDMQEGFYKRGGTTNSPGLNSLVKNQMRLVEWSARKGIPVLIFEYAGYGKTDPRIMNLITHHKHKVITKYTDGGFYWPSRNETLALLKDWKVDSLIVAGINGPYCVESTILGALEAGYNVMTTSWLIGEINQNPPIFPNGSWYFKDAKFTVFPTLESIIGPN